jgi:hypothetical protein
MAEIHTLRPIEASAPGDFNDDGKVNAADYDVWKAAYGSTTELAADGNKDGIVDAADFAVWRKGSTGDAAAATSATGSNGVPEPVGAPVVVLAIALCCSRSLLASVATKRVRLAATQRVAGCTGN